MRVFRAAPLASVARSFASVQSLGIDKLGITNSKAPLFRNLSYDEIFKHEIANKEGVVAANGCFAVDTGKFTGRSPKDKWLVKQSPSDKLIWWGEINQPINNQTFDDLYARAVGHYNENAQRIYVFDGYCGANPNTQKKVRIITEIAWQHHFVTNMFLRPRTRDEIKDFKPDFTVINASRVLNPNWKQQKLNSDVFVAFNVEKDVAVIGGTWYGGEMKKGIFSMMNYWLPNEGIMPMHCSANKGKSGDTALFFGLSGTGKTTLSADPKRFLIGDDEHGWDNEGIFNFEGGCYAKTIALSEQTEPDIYRAIKRDALLENVWLEGANNTPDYFNKKKTENGRVSYPIYHIPNYEPTAMGGHPDNVIFLTCDAFGVLPPVARLNGGQAQYHFLSGYTAKVAGTERGIVEPQATFSTCFGAAFMTQHPTVYAALLKKKLEKHGSKVWLVNTGWSGGAYGTGKRMSIKTTRTCIDAILDGSINNAEFAKDPLFGFEVPKALHGVESNVLQTKNTWADKKSFDDQAKKLASMFQKNFKKYITPGFPDFSEYGPKQL